MKKRRTATPPEPPQAVKDSKKDEKKPAKEKERASPEKDENKAMEVEQKAQDGEPTTPPEPPQNGECTLEAREHTPRSKSSSPKLPRDDELDKDLKKQEDTVEVKGMEKAEVGEPGEGRIEATAGIADTPQSPPPDKKGEEETKLLLGAKLGPESDLSSGEDFKDSESEAFPLNIPRPEEAKDWKEGEQSTEVKEAVHCEVELNQEQERERVTEPVEERKEKTEPRERKLLVVLNLKV